MKRPAFPLLTLLALLLLTACSRNDPGPLAGTWEQTGPMKMTVHFRPGETEALGIIEKVSYEVQGQDVLVSYKNGLMKGSTVRYTLIDPDTARNEMGTLRRVREN